jgi:hypothetical protein
MKPGRSRKFDGLPVLHAADPLSIDFDADSRTCARCSIALLRAREHHHRRHPGFLAGVAPEAPWRIPSGNRSASAEKSESGRSRVAFR